MCFLVEETRFSWRQRVLEVGEPLTDFERLVELDGICPETPRDPYNLARFPVGCGKSRPLRESLEFVLDDA